MPSTETTKRSSILMWAKGRYRWKRKGLLGPFPFLSEDEVARLKGAIKKQRLRSGLVATRNRHIDLPALAMLCVDPKP